MRTPTLLALAALLAAPSLAHAQWSVTAQAGVHVDRLGAPTRVLDDEGSGSFMMNAKGEAGTIALRIARVLNPRFSVDAGVASSRNRSWVGGTAAPVPDFEKRTTFVSAAVHWHALDEATRIGISLGAGPAVIFHGGTGESTLTRQTDFGALLVARTSIGVGERVRIGLDIQDYQFASHFGDKYEGERYLEEFESGTRWRSELVILPSLRIQF